MSAVNTAIIEIVEAVLDSKGKMQDDDAFNDLMDVLLQDTKKFWDEHKDVIPTQYHVFFEKCK